MFRLAIAVLAVVGLVSLFNGASGAAAGAGLLFLFPLLLLAKVFFFIMLFGFMGRRFGRSGSLRYEPPWSRRERAKGDAGEQQSREDTFDEWHRMAHAREEVDSWLEDVD
jgi:hypothetical protein